MFVENTRYPKIVKLSQALLKECIGHTLGLSSEAKIKIEPLIVFADNAQKF